MAIKYFTVNQYADENPAFSQGGLRHLIFNENSNGLAESGAVVRVGRKVLIDGDKFADWIASQHKTVEPKAKPKARKSQKAVNNTANRW